VESVTDAREVTTVYNIAVADYHTYYVGSSRWDFSVWAHNATLCWNSMDRGIEALKRMEAQPVDPTAAARAHGYQPTNYRSHGQPVYYNPKTKTYITPDVDSHTGGVWKGATSVPDLGSKNTRTGTYDGSLKRIGD
jgi:hypothetical protein